MLRRIALFLAVSGAMLASHALDAANAPSIMPSSQVKAGMTGHGVTTLSAGGAQEFEFEVLGVMRGAFAKGDMILIRMSGPIIDDAGVIAGMSGSPLYIDDKLIGAVAYGWRYCPIPLAGVTPAEEMLQVARIDKQARTEPPVDARAEARHRFQDRARKIGELLTSRRPDWDSHPQLRQTILQMCVPRVLRAQQAPSAQGLLPSAVANMLPAGADPRIRPLPIPLAIGGLGSTSARLTSLLQAGGMMPVQAASRGSETSNTDVEVKAGIPVGAVFIRGDLDMAGMGTLTWVDGNRILAFGHPMYGLGEVDYPMAIGHVQTVVPSLNNSFRLTTSGEIVGRVTQDRQTAILGRLGEQAPMFPCTVRVRGSVNETYNYEIAGYWDTAPFFAFYAVSASSERWEGAGNPYMLDATAKIKVSGRDEPIVLSNSYASYGVVSPSSELVEFPLAQLVLNPFRKVAIEGVEYELEARPGFQAAYVQSVRADRVQAAPGSEVALFVRLRQYRGDEVTRKVMLRIPETAQPGTKAKILVCDAVSDRMVQFGADPGFFEPRDFEAMVDVLEGMESNKNLIVRASFVEQGVRYDGRAMPSLPESALGLLQSDSSDGRAAPLLRDVRTATETPWVLEGAQTVSIAIKQPDTYKP